MHTIDIILLIFFAAAFLYGFKNGLISAVLTLAGLVASFFLIARFAPMVKAGIIGRLPLDDGFLSTALAYILIFILVFIIVAILKMILNAIAKALCLNLINRVFGGLFGLFNMFVILLLFIAIINLFPLKKFHNFLNKSIVIRESTKVYEYVKKDYRKLLPAELLK